MATTTKAKVRDLALQKIGVLPAGQAASGEDASLVDGLVDAMFEEMDSVLAFASDAIPLWARESLVDVVAAMASPYFGNAPISRSKEAAVGDYQTAKCKHIGFDQREHEPDYY